MTTNTEPPNEELTWESKTQQKTWSFDGDFDGNFQGSLQDGNELQYTLECDLNDPIDFDQWLEQDKDGGQILSTPLFAGFPDENACPSTESESSKNESMDSLATLKALVYTLKLESVKLVVLLIADEH